MKLEKLLLLNVRLLILEACNYKSLVNITWARDVESREYFLSTVTHNGNSRINATTRIGRK